MIIKDFDLDEVFLLSEILDKMNLKIDTSKLTGKVSTDKLESMDDVKALGKDTLIAVIAELITDVIKNLWKAKNLVVKLISNLTGMKPEEVKKMGIKQLKEFFTELIEQPDFKNFLESAGE